MKLIAHRGLTNGPNELLENSPEQILQTLDRGYDCEIDFWIVDNVFYLGHDAPQYQIEKHFIEDTRYWIHAKNLNALYYLLGTKLNFFWHQTDDFTLTSNGYIWAYPGKELTNKSIMVMPEWQDKTLNNARDASCYGVCSDYVGQL